MAKEAHQFDEAFAKLTATISDQARGDGIICLDENIWKPFESTFAPTSNQTLHNLARIFEGNDSHSLFLRLDGSTIYLVVSTVLQFPPCSLLTKTVHFFMDMLSLYTDTEDAQHALQTYLNEPLLEKEVRRRQAYIFSQLIPRLKALLFEEDKHYKVKRLIAQLITRLCQRNARGWKELMNVQKTQLFGALLDKVDDYVLRVLIADIVRHLLANNYDVHELWDHSSEEVMDFPTSQELLPKTVSKVLNSMSALDAKRAFNQTRQSRLYRIADINIPDIQYHSAQSDTILIVDDNLALLVPDRDRDGTLFAIHEIPITQEMFLERVQTPTKQASQLRIRWRTHHGSIVLRGKKERVKDIHLQFAQHSNRDEFCDAFDAAFKRRAGSSWLGSSQEDASTIPRLRRIVVKPIDLSEMEHEFEQDLYAHRKRGIENTMKGKSKSTRNMSRQISSEPIIEQVAITSDIFARISDNDEDSEKRLTSFSKKLRSKDAGENLQVSPPMLLSSRDDYDEGNEASSPLKIFGRRKNGEEAAVRSHESAPANPALSVPLHQHNDDDYASFTVVASRANASTNEETSTGLDCRQKKVYRNSSLIEQGEPLKSAKGNNKPIEMVRPTAEVPTSVTHTEVREVAVAPKKASQTASSFLKSKTSKPLVQNSGLTAPSPSHRNDSMQMQAPGRKKNLGRSGNEEKTSRDVDWDEDLRTNEHKPKRQKTEPKGTMKAPARKPLRDVTNTSQHSTASSSLIGRSKVSSKSKVTAKKIIASPAAATAPARRSRRTAVKQAKSYVESSPSEDEGIPEEGSEEDDQGARLDKPSSLAQSGVQRISQQKETKTKPLPLTLPAPAFSQKEMTMKASRNNSTARALTEVASSDHEDEVDVSLAGEASTHSEDRQPNGDSAVSAGTQAEDEDEILEDSYPGQNQQPREESTAADRSFGTKLSNMIATTPATVAKKKFHASTTPFGDHEQFVHNINAARRIKSPPEKTTLSLAVPIATSTTILQPRTTDVSSPIKPQQELQNTAATVTISIRQDAGSRAASARINPQLSLGDTDLRVEDAGSSMPTDAKAPKIGREDLNKEDEPFPNHTYLTSASKTIRDGEHQPQLLAEGLEKQGNSHQDERDTDAMKPAVTQSAEPVAQSSSKPAINFRPNIRALAAHAPGKDSVATLESPAISRKEKRDISEPQHRRTTSSKGSRRHGLGTSDRASVDHKKLIKNASESDQTLAVASNKATIIHFGNIGPQNQGSPSKARIVNTPTIRQQPSTNKASSSLPPVYKQEGLQSTNTLTQTKASDTNRPALLRSNHKSKDNDMRDSLHTRDTSEEQRSGFVDEDCSHDLVGDTVFDEILQDSVVPSGPAEVVKKVDATSRRSDRVNKSRQFSPVASCAQSLTSEKNTSIELEPEGQSSRPEPYGSSQEKPIYVSSTYTSSEVSQDLDTSDAEESIRKNHAEHATQEIETTSKDPKDQNLERPLRESKSQNTAPLTSTQLREDQEASTAHSRKRPPPEQKSESTKERLLPMDNIPLSAIVTHEQEDSRLFSLSTTARNIFSKGDTSNILDSTTSIGKPSGTKLLQITRSFNEAGTNPNGEVVRASVHKWPSVPKLPHPAKSVQPPNQKARQEPADPVVPGVKTAKANGQSEAMNQTTNNLNIVRVKQQQPFTDKNFSNVSITPVLPVSTPHAFVQRLHALTSPMSTTTELYDVERTQNWLPDDSDLAQTTLVGQTHSSRSMRLPTSKPTLTSEVSSSSMSPGSEVGRPTTIQGRQQHSRHVQSVSTFASTIQKTVLDITQEIAFLVDAEERLAMIQVENYRTGSLEVAKELRCNSISRLDYDARKLATVLTGQRQLVVEAKLQLSEKPPPVTGCKQACGHVEQYKVNTLAMLDNLQH